MHNHRILHIIVSLLFLAFSLEFKFDSRIVESKFTELSYRMLNSGSDYEIIGSIVLKHKPHALYIVLGISPVTK